MHLRFRRILRDEVPIPSMLAVNGKKGIGGTLDGARFICKGKEVAHVLFDVNEVGGKRAIYEHLQDQDVSW